VIVAAEGASQCIAAAIGFFLGVAVLLVLGILLPEHGDEDNREESGRIQLASNQERLSLMGAAKQSREIFEEQLRRTSGENQPLVSPVGNRVEGTRSFPAALLIAMSIDSLIDGLLIGLVTNAGASAGPMLSVSLSVEMSFLGLTLATALKGHPLLQTIPASFLGPATRK